VASLVRLLCFVGDIHGIRLISKIFDFHGPYPDKRLDFVQIAQAQACIHTAARLNCHPRLDRALSHQLETSSCDGLRIFGQPGLSLSDPHKVCYPSNPMLLQSLFDGSAPLVRITAQTIETYPSRLLGRRLLSKLPTRNVQPAKDFVNQDFELGPIGADQIQNLIAPVLVHHDASQQHLCFCSSDGFILLSKITLVFFVQHPGPTAPTQMEPVQSVPHAGKTRKVGPLSAM
jgi:hypothetical protein